MDSINIWDDAIRYKLLVRLPVLTVPARGDQQREHNGGRTCLLDFTHLIITELSMDEQHEEVNGVEVCDRRVETGGKRPRNSHQPITAECDVNKTPELQGSGNTDK